jgi:hypothetical protein
MAAVGLATVASVGLKDNPIQGSGYQSLDGEGEGSPQHKYGSRGIHSHYALLF